MSTTTMIIIITTMSLASAKNGEASVDVAQQLPAIARDLSDAPPDVVILDLSIGDALNEEWHWFEVVVRGVLTLWPVSMRGRS